MLWIILLRTGMVYFLHFLLNMTKVFLLYYFAHIHIRSFLDTGNRLNQPECKERELLNLVSLDLQALITPTLSCSRCLKYIRSQKSLTSLSSFGDWRSHQNAQLWAGLCRVGLAARSAGPLISPAGMCTICKKHPRNVTRPRWTDQPKDTELDKGEKMKAV